ncbi:hypothetical protein [Maridesulfovibrio zosterae]|uniref:hypothetical protein n=1 Tax=Maridesulfovibrio zosterae TaxID=82171 RepID=UPI000422B072|nr:hypothetical protein [Maridesulfovibrio zosterae]
MKKMILLFATMAIFGGCGSWHNPNIVDPSKEKEILAQDKDFCTKLTKQNVPVGAQTDGAPPEPTTYEAVFSDDYASAKTFDECMKGRGWQK